MKKNVFIKILSNKWFVLLFNTAFFIIMAWLLPIHFEENDDATMCMIANGHYSGTPDGHLVFINAIYGWVIASLYMVADIVEWYTLSFCVLHILAMSVIMYILLNKMKIAIWLKLVFIAFAYIYWIRIIIAFQFTTTAGLLCFSGCLALLQPNTKQGAMPSQREGRVWKIFGLFAILTASMIRFNASALVGFMCLPMFVDAFMVDRRFVYWLVTLLMIVLCAKYADGLFYKSPDWAFYKAYNAVRGAINDNPYSDLSPEELPNGISKLDYDLFRWFAADVNVMTLDRIEDIHNTINTKLSIAKCFNNCKQLRLFLFPILFVSIGLAICSVVTTKKRPYPLLTLLFFFVMLGYFGCLYLLKYRVFLCMLLPLVYQILYWFSPSSQTRLGNMSYVVVAFTLLGVCAKYIKQDVGLVNHINGWNKSVIEKYINPLCEGKEDWIICTSLGNLDYTPFIHPFQFHKLHNSFVNLSWTVASPLNKGVLENHKDFVDSKILCFCPMKDFCGKITETPDSIIKAIKKNYQIEVDTCIVECNEKYALFQMKSHTRSGFGY